MDLSEKLLTRNTLSPEVVNVLRGGTVQKRNDALNSVLGLELRERNLKRARLVGAVLPKADLRWAQLQDADLGEAQLQGAYLWGANLDWVNFTDADLAFADLIGAKNLETAELAGAEYLFAELTGTFLDINQPSPAP